MTRYTRLVWINNQKKVLLRTYTGNNLLIPFLVCFSWVSTEKKRIFLLIFFESSLIYLSTTQAHFPFQSNLTALTITSLEMQAFAILHLAFFHQYMKFLINTPVFFVYVEATVKWNRRCILMSARDWNTTTNSKVNIKQCTYIIRFSLCFLSTIADWHCRMTSMNVKACRSVWGSLLDACPQSPSYKRYDVIGGTVYILKSETIDYIEVDLCQDCSHGFGGKNRLETWPVEFL